MWVFAIVNLVSRCDTRVFTVCRIEERLIKNVLLLGLNLFSLCSFITFSTIFLQYRPPHCMHKSCSNARIINSPIFALSEAIVL